MSQVQLKSVDNGGLVEVDDEYAARLLESGLWERVSAGRGRSRGKATEPVEEE